LLPGRRSPVQVVVCKGCWYSKVAKAGSCRAEGHRFKTEGRSCSIVAKAVSCLAEGHLFRYMVYSKVVKAFSCPLDAKWASLAKPPSRKPFGPLSPMSHPPDPLIGPFAPSKPSLPPPKGLLTPFDPLPSQSPGPLKALRGVRDSLGGPRAPLSAQGPPCRPKGPPWGLAGHQAPFQSLPILVPKALGAFEPPEPNVSSK